MVFPQFTAPRPDMCESRQATHSPLLDHPLLITDALDVPLHDLVRT
ncbi:hypothetical protein ABZ172_16730 [Streptomyces sp. NPDC006296]